MTVAVGAKLDPLLCCVAAPPRGTRTTSGCGTAQQGWPRFGGNADSEVKRVHGNQTRPPEGPQALVFQATGGQPKPTGWRNWGVDQSGSLQQIASSLAPWAAVEAEPAGKVGQSTVPPLPSLPAGKRLVPQGGLRPRAQTPLSYNGDASLGLQARAAGARSQGPGGVPSPIGGRRRETLAPGSVHSRNAHSCQPMGGLAIGVPLPRQCRRTAESGGSSASR